MLRVFPTRTRMRNTIAAKVKSCCTRTMGERARGGRRGGGSGSGCCCGCCSSLVDEDGGGEHDDSVFPLMDLAFSFARRK